MNSSKRDESAIDVIEHELYDPKSSIGGTTLHHTKSHRDLNLPTSWGEDIHVLSGRDEDKTLSFGLKMLFVATSILLVALLFTFWRVASLRNVVSASNIDMNAEIAPFIEGGDMTKLVVTLNNRNTVLLESSSVTLSYKQGNGSQDEQEKVKEKRDLGSIKTGEYKKQDFSVVLYGQEGEARDLVVKLEYKVAGSNAVFNKVVTAHVVLRAPPVSVHLEAPEKLSMNQSGNFSIRIKNNAATTSLPVSVVLTVPNSFTLETSTPKPLPRSVAWKFDSLSPNEEKVISLSGFFVGKSGEVGTVSVKLGSPGDSQAMLGVVYSSDSKDIKLEDAPLVLTMNLLSTHAGNDVVLFGDKANVMVTYVNTSSEAIVDASIVMSLSGDALLYEEITPSGGYYDSVAKTITWDKASFPEMAILAPHAQGTLRVVLPIVQKGVNSPSFTAALLGKGVVKDEGIMTTLSKKWGVEGTVSLSAFTQYRNSPFPNTGPIPPQPNKETSYDVKLVISAQNTLASSKVSFTLPAYVSFRDVVSDPSMITYDARTRTVTWTPGSLKEGTIISVDIGLTAKPSQSHVGQSPALTSGIVLEADEEVSRSHIKTTLSPVTTALHDEMWPENPSLVVKQ